MSYEVSRRAREIGIRMPLAAERRWVIALILRGGVWIASVGVLGGAVIVFVVAGSPGVP